MTNMEDKKVILRNVRTPLGWDDSMIQVSTESKNQFSEEDYIEILHAHGRFGEKEVYLYLSITEAKILQKFLNETL